MTRAIEEWPERFTDPYSGITYSDFDRGRLHGGVMVCPNRCWPLLDEKWEAMISEGPTPAGEEFTITTDPTEAPADCQDEWWIEMLLNMCHVMTAAICKELGVPESRYMTVGMLFGIAGNDETIAAELKTADDALREYLKGAT